MPNAKHQPLTNGQFLRQKKENFHGWLSKKIVKDKKKNTETAVMLDILLKSSVEDFALYFKEHLLPLKKTEIIAEKLLTDHKIDRSNFEEIDLSLFKKYVKCFKKCLKEKTV